MNVRDALQPVVQVIQDPGPSTPQPGMAEFELCVRIAVAGAAICGVAAVALGYSVVLCGVVGFVAAGVAARSGVRSGLRQRRLEALREDKLPTLRVGRPRR